MWCLILAFMSMGGTMALLTTLPVRKQVLPGPSLYLHPNPLERIPASPIRRRAACKISAQRTYITVAVDLEKLSGSRCPGKVRFISMSEMAAEQWLGDLWHGRWRLGALPTKMGLTVDRLLFWDGPCGSQQGQAVDQIRYVNCTA